jgi:hypothetical protein
MNRNRNRAKLSIPLLVVVALSTAQAQTSSSGLQVNPAQVQKKATMAPPAGTAKVSSVGENVKMSTPPNSDAWGDQLDVDGNGTLEITTLVWDAKHKVLFSDSSGKFTCKNGATGGGELLIAVDGTGNTWGRPVGAGFWIASMDKGDCGVPANALWGCKFDANGAATACGVATLNQQQDDIAIVTAQR